MDRGNMHPPEYAGDQGDAELDVMLAAADDRLLTAVRASLDLDAGLADIIGEAPRPGVTGGDDLAASSPGETEDLRFELARLRAEPIAEVTASNTNTSAIDESAWAYHDRPWRPVLLVLAAVAVMVFTAANIILGHAKDPEIGPAAYSSTAPARSPSPISVAPDGGELQILVRTFITFAQGQDQLSDSAKFTLRSLASQMKTGSASIEINGFADPAGSSSANRQLPLARARAVAVYLNACGISSYDIQQLGVVSRNAAGVPPQGPGGVIIRVQMAAHPN